MTPSGFAVVGCTKCRKMQVADLSYATKTCACGHRIHLAAAHLLVVCDTADDCGNALRSLTAGKNSGFAPASLPDPKKRS